MIKTIIRLEGLLIFLASLYFYNRISGNWLLFAILLFSLDISMVGYLKDKKLGATIYNFGHNYLLGGILLLSGVYFQNHICITLGLIALAHVGMDRFFGFGLKYPTDFKDTHLQKI